MILISGYMKRCHYSFWMYRNYKLITNASFAVVILVSNINLIGSLARLILGTKITNERQIWSCFVISILSRTKTNIYPQRQLIWQIMDLIGTWAGQYCILPVFSRDISWSEKEDWNCDAIGGPLQALLVLQGSVSISLYISFSSAMHVQSIYLFYSDTLYEVA